MNDTRAVLLRLIQAAPDPCGFDKTAPDYQRAWNEARALLRSTCPAHNVVDGTCSQCHGDEEG